MDSIAPYYCCSCGQIGELLCDSCKYDIVDEYVPTCLICQKPTLFDGSCAQCQSIVKRSWILSRREGALEELINNYKFDYTESAYKLLGDLLLQCLPELPSNTILVHIPTVRAHIRQRGYDHTKLLAQYLASERKLEHRFLLERATNTRQRGANRALRIQQAKVAFGVKGQVSEDGIYLLIDDIVTTGATIIYASQALQKAGATNIWAAALARQTLDKRSY